MKGYKGFNPGLICKDKQYQENTVFEEPEAKICEKGMHFCENPFDVLDYYDLIRSDGTPNEFAEVEALDEPKTDDKKKFCSRKLKIGVKLGLSGFIKACVDFVLEKTIAETPRGNVDSGDCAQIGSSGDCAQIGSSGNYARIGSSGNYARIGSSGTWLCGKSANWLLDYTCRVEIRWSKATMRSGMCENGVCRWRKNQSGYTVHAEKRGVCGG